MTSEKQTAVWRVDSSLGGSVFAAAEADEEAVLVDEATQLVQYLLRETLDVVGKRLGHQHRLCSPDNVRTASFIHLLRLCSRICLNPSIAVPISHQQSQKVLHQKIYGTTT